MERNEGIFEFKHQHWKWSFVGSDVASNRKIPANSNKKELIEKISRTPRVSRMFETLEKKQQGEFRLRELKLCSALSRNGLITTWLLLRWSNLSLKQSHCSCSKNGDSNHLCFRSHTLPHDQILVGSSLQPSTDCF